MSIIKIAQIEDIDSEEYLQIVGRIYYKFENLYRLMRFYSIEGSSNYILLAKKCFERAIADELENFQREKCLSNK